MNSESISGFFLAQQSGNVKVAKSPALKVSIFRYDLAKKAVIGEAIATDITVMLDTGANVSSLDKSYLTGLEPAGHVGVTKMDRREVLDFYIIAFRVAGLPHNYIAMVAAAEITSAKKSFSGLLGMDFIQNFKMSLDYKAGIVNLEPT